MRFSVAVFANLALLAGSCVAIGAERPPGFVRYTDEALRQLPPDIETLSLRGARGYGTDEVTELGFTEVARFKHLRVLHAVALGLTDRSLAVIGELAELEELSLSINAIEGNELHHLKKLKKLRKLDLNFNPMLRKWPNIVSELSSLEELHAVIDKQLTRSLSGFGSHHCQVVDASSVKVPPSGDSGYLPTFFWPTA